MIGFEAGILDSFQNTATNVMYYVDSALGSLFSGDNIFTDKADFLSSTYIYKASDLLEPHIANKDLFNNTNKVGVAVGNLEQVGLSFYGGIEGAKYLLGPGLGVLGGGDAAIQIVIAADGAMEVEGVVGVTAGLSAFAMTGQNVGPDNNTEI